MPTVAGGDSGAESYLRPGNPGADDRHRPAPFGSGWANLGDDPAARRPLGDHRPGGQARPRALGGYPALGEGSAG